MIPTFSRPYTQMDKIRLNELRTGYLFLVSNKTALGDAISEVESLTNTRKQSQWNHSGSIKILSYSIMAIEMQPKGLMPNNLSKYASTKTLIAIPKFPYSEALCDKYVDENIGKKKYSFKQLLFLLLKAISLGCIDLTHVQSDEEICSEEGLEMLNYASAGAIPYWRGQKPADIAAMTDKFEFKILIYA